MFILHQVKEYLPAAMRPNSMVQVYSSTAHGFSFTTLLNRINNKERAKLMTDSTIILVQDVGGNVSVSLSPLI
jgi:hypothetical protein